MLDNKYKTPYPEFRKPPPIWLFLYHIMYIYNIKLLGFYSTSSNLSDNNNYTNIKI